MDSDASLMYSFYIDIYDQSNLMSFNNYQLKKGVLTFSGKEIVPFKYDWIEIDELTGKIKCGYFSEENKQEDIYTF